MRSTGQTSDRLGTQAREASSEVHPVERQQSQKSAALQRIYWLAENYPNPDRSNVQELAVSYARGEVQEEWPLMGKGRVSPHAEQRADQLARAVRELSPKTGVQSELYTDAPACLLFRDQIQIGTGRALLQRQGYAVGLTAGSGGEGSRNVQVFVYP